MRTPTRLALGLLALPFLAVSAWPQESVPAAATLSPEAVAIVAECRKDCQVMDHLDYLTNSIGGRVTGSTSLVLACEWAAETLEGFGLKNVRLEEWGEIPVSFDRGPWFGAMNWKDGAGEHRLILEFNTPAWSAGTRGLRKGKAILMPKDEAGFKQVEKQLKGAWLVQERSARGRRGGRRGGNQAQGFNVLNACREAGILGTISGAGDHYLRTNGSRNWRQMSMDKLPTQAQITVVRDQHAQLLELLGKGVEVDLEFYIQNRFRKGPVKLLNVVADIPGTEKPDEFVLVGGHIDSWDGSAGAVDNGSGCATAMEAVRLIMKAGVKPKRTIRIVMWGGEEQGLLGSRAYVQQHRAELPKISAYLNHDSGTNAVAGVTCTEAMKADMEKAFAGVGAIDEGIGFAINVVPGIRGGGSDHSSFIRAGVPAWSWRLKGDHNYRHIWHTQFDNYEQAVEEYQTHSAMVIAIGAVGLANLDNLLSREKMVAQGGGGRRRFNPGIELEGTTVTGIQADGPFAKAGFKKGDKILRVGETAVEEVRDLYMAAFRAEGKPIEVTVKRGGKEVKLKFTVEMRRRR